MSMELSFAPMEGVTYAAFRRSHARLFGGAEKYYAPFIAPNGDGSYKTGNRRDVLPENNEGITLIPQILCNAPEPFLLVAKELEAMGYDEVNLNAGCPSGTVVSKFKGSGMLRDLENLEHCLDVIFSTCPLKVSVKTRMGVHSTEEFAAIMDVYRKFPLSLLTVHARDRDGMYKSSPDLERFESALEGCPFPVEYNGNVFSAKDAEETSARFPGVDKLMIGRGAVADPSLLRRIKGGAALSAKELQNFHDELLEEYLASGLAPHHAIPRMKELWSYFRFKFPGEDKNMKNIFKSKNMPDYKSAVSTIFSIGNFDPDGEFSW